MTTGLIAVEVLAVVRPFPGKFRPTAMAFSI